MCACHSITLRRKRSLFVVDNFRETSIDRIYTKLCGGCVKRVWKGSSLSVFWLKECKFRIYIYIENEVVASSGMFLRAHTSRLSRLSYKQSGEEIILDALHISMLFEHLPGRTDTLAQQVIKLGGIKVSGFLASIAFFNCFFSMSRRIFDACFAVGFRSRAGLLQG